MQITHTHEHTHEVTFGGRPKHGDIEHSHDHINESNEHHHYSEEPHIESSVE